MLQLAVAVELVPEEIPQADRTRPHSLRDLRQGGLVYLEQAKLSVLCRQKARRDAGAQVRAGGVVREPDARREDPRGHRGGRRLAVCGRDEHRPERKPPRQPVEDLGVERREHLAGHGRPAARADEPRQPRSHPRARDPDG
jgi:hypothetical protein